MGLHEFKIIYRIGILRSLGDLRSKATDDEESKNVRSFPFTAFRVRMTIRNGVLNEN